MKERSGTRQQLVEAFIDAWDEDDDERQRALRREASQSGVDLDRQARTLAVLRRLSETLAAGETEGRRELEEPELLRLDRFERLERIGRGGQSSVYKAYDTRLHRTVALKVLEDLYGNVQAWMENEGASMAQLDHPGIVRVHEPGEAEGRVFLITEFVDGPSLHVVLEHMRGHAEQPDPRAEELAAALGSIAARCRFAAECARALHYAHERGVVHLDVKPGNVLITTTAHPKLIDFGLARSVLFEGPEATRTGLYGTAAYLSPERARPGTATPGPRSDVFSLGIVLYELFTLRNPFYRGSPAESLNAIARVDAPPPSEHRRDLPTDLDRIVLHCLERDPDERYASALRLAEDLEAFLDHRAISIEPPSLPKLVRLWVRRNRARIAWTGVAVVIFIATLYAGLVHDRNQERKHVLGGLAALEASLPQLTEPRQFEEAYIALETLGNRARTLDASLFAPPFAGPTAASVRETGDRLSVRMREVLGAEEQQISQIQKDAIQDVEMEELLILWSQPLHSDERLCPDSPHNEIDRTRGQIEFAALSPGEEESLLAQKFDEKQIPFMLPVTRDDELRRGTYRFSIWDASGELAREVDCDMRFALEKRLVDPRPLSADWADAFTLIPSVTLTIETWARRGKPVSGERTLPDFLVTRHVTWRDLRAALSEDEVRDLKGKALSFQDFFRPLIPKDLTLLEEALEQIDDDLPATIPWAYAQMFAERVGARLPTWLEAQAIPRNGEAGVFVDTERGLERLAAFEWTSTPAPDDLRQRLGFVIGEPGTQKQLGEKATVHAGAVFRLARSASRW